MARVTDDDSLREHQPTTSIQDLLIGDDHTDLTLTSVRDTSGNALPPIVRTKSLEVYL